MFKKTLILTITFLLISCAGPTHLYEGEPKDKEQLGHYSRTGAAGFFSNSTIYTLRIDDLDLNKTDKAVWGQVYLTPGHHSVALTFINYDWKVVPLTEFSAAHFKGEYIVNFVVKPGYKYMPMFDLAKKDQSDFFNKLCIAETQGSKGWGDLKKAEAIVSCADASIEVKPENFGCPPGHASVCEKK